MFSVFSLLLLLLLSICGCCCCFFILFFLVCLIVFLLTQFPFPVFVRQCPLAPSRSASHSQPRHSATPFNATHTAGILVLGSCWVLEVLISWTKRDFGVGHRLRTEPDFIRMRVCINTHTRTHTCIDMRLPKINPPPPYGSATDLETFEFLYLVCARASAALPPPPSALRIPGVW